MKRTAWVSIGGLTAFGLLLWRQVLVGGKVFFWHDVSLAYMPLRKIAGDAIAGGHLPLWAPQLGCGFPVLAEGQAGVFYPLHLIGYLGLPYYHAYSAYVFLHCLMGAVFAAMLCRRLRMSWQAGVIAGLVYGYSGFFVTHVLHITMLEAAAWLPLILYCLYGGLASGKVGWWIGGAAAMAMAFVAGHPQIAFYEVVVVAVVLGAYLCGLWETGQRAGLRIRRAMAAASVVLVLGGGLAAVQLAPTYALADFAGRRAEVTPAYLRELAMAPRNLAYMIHPYIFGSYADNNYFGGDHYYEVCGYAGVLTLPLAVMGLALWPGRQRWVMATLVVGGLSLALANQNPLYELFPRVPGFNMFRAPGRWVMVFTLGLAVLAAMGTELLAGPRRRQAGRLAMWLAGGGLLGMAAVSTAVCLMEEPITGLLARLLMARHAAAADAAARAAEKYQFICARLGFADPFWLAVAGGMVVLGICGVLSARRKRGGNWYYVLLWAALATELFVFGDHYNGVCNPSYYTSPPVLARWMKANDRWGRVYSDVRLFDIQFAPPGYDGYASGDVEPFIAERETLRPNRPALWGLWCADAQYGLVPQRHYDLLEGYVQQALAGDSKSVRHALMVLRMLGVRYLLVSADDPPAGVVPEGPRVGPVAVKLLEPLPRCWIARQVVCCRSRAEALAAIVDAGFDATRQAVVEGFGEQVGEGEGKVEMLSDKPGYVRLRVEMKRRGLVVNDAYNPNWQATVDGQAAKVLVTNYILRGVIVPQGAHVVEFEYVPRPLYAGALVSLLSVVALCALAAVARQSATREGGR